MSICLYESKSIMGRRNLVGKKEIDGKLSIIETTYNDDSFKSEINKNVLICNFQEIWELL